MEKEMEKEKNIMKMVIKYDGEWINGKAEGNGKGIYEKGKYYIGQWKNGLRNGVD